MQRCRNDLTQEELKALLHYDPETGVFTRNGAEAGSSRGHSYIRIHVAGFLYYGHRLAWLYMTGRWPAPGVDHRDGNGMNNRWSNLRECDQERNLQNLRASRGPTSKFLGVCWHAGAGKWRATIRAAGETRHLGLFEDEQDARDKYLAEKRRLHEFCEI